jgi:hypothetical protein
VAVAAVEVALVVEEEVVAVARAVAEKLAGLDGSSGPCVVAAVPARLSECGQGPKSKAGR